MTSQRTEGKVQFACVEDIANFLDTHRDMKITIADAISEIKFPKMDLNQMVLHRIHPQATNEILQNYIMDFIKQKLQRPLAFIVNKFQSGSSASVQFLSDANYTDAYKVMIEDEFTIGLGAKLFPENPPKIVSVEEGTRRLDCKEKMCSDGEILKIIVQKFNSTNDRRVPDRYQNQP